jgi:hypothetical protein
MLAATVRNANCSLSKSDLYRGFIVGAGTYVVGTLFSWPNSAKILVTLITTVAVTRLNSYQRYLRLMQQSAQNQERDFFELEQEMMELAQEFFPLRLDERSQEIAAFAHLASSRSALVERVMKDSIMRQIYQAHGSDILTTLQAVQARDFLLCCQRVFPSYLSVQIRPDDFSKLISQATELKAWMKKNSKDPFFSIKKFELASLGLFSFPLEFLLYFPELTQVDLSRNRITHIPEDLKNHQNFKWIDLRANTLCDDSKMFALQIRHCQILVHDEEEKS